MYLVNVTLHPLIFPKLNAIKRKLFVLGFFSSLKWGKSPHSSIWIQNSWWKTEGCSSCSLCFSHRNNKWTYSVRMGEWINQQRCCFVWNATINHRGLMSEEGKVNGVRSCGERMHHLLLFITVNQLEWTWGSLKVRRDFLNITKLKLSSFSLFGDICSTHWSINGPLMVNNIIVIENNRKETWFTLLKEATILTLL